MPDLQITVAQLRGIEGRCAYHSADLELVPHADEGLDDPAEAWDCPGMQDDPDVIAWSKVSHQPWYAEGTPEEAARVRRIEEWGEAGRLLRKRCEDSWTFTIPLPETGTVQ
jgi:hypothetical protein